MAISAKDVMALRKKSGLGMMECKAALTETDGDMAAAETLLRERGLAKMDGRTDREAAEGRVAALISDDATRGAIVEVSSETDFVAKNDAFIEACNKIAAEAIKQEGDVDKNDAITQIIDDVRVSTKENCSFKRGKAVGGSGSKVGAYVHHNGKVGALVEVDGDVDAATLSDLCMHVVAAVPTPLGIVDEDIDASLLEEERKVARAQAVEQRKPENIIDKIVEGKIRKFFEDNTLLKQAFVKDDKKRVQDILPKGTTVKSFVRYELGG